MNERFIIQQSTTPYFWVATDKEHGIVVKFENHKFNDTQVATLLDDNHFGNLEEALNFSTYMRELGDWLVSNHSEKAF